MKTVILCGGRGSRLSEETSILPKPMVRVGNDPILYHIMNIYDKYNITDFVLALGYKGECISQFFQKFAEANSNLQINLADGSTKYLSKAPKNWKISLIHTGYNTLTGGRLLRLKDYLKDEDSFMLTYGDGVANVNISELIKFHRSHGKIATVTAVRPPSRFGEMDLDKDQVVNFSEKSRVKVGWINGGFFVFKPEIFDYLENDQTILERDPLEGVAQAGQLMAFKHDKFWQCMDTLRDKDYLNSLWDSGDAPWL